MIMVFPFFLAVSLVDAAAFFIVVRLVRRAVSAAPIRFLDRIGGVGVDVIAAAVGRQVRRVWSGPLPEPVEEAVALGFLAAVRLILSAVV